MGLTESALAHAVSKANRNAQMANRDQDSRLAGTGVVESLAFANLSLPRGETWLGITDLRRKGHNQVRLTLA